MLNLYNSAWFFMVSGTMGAIFNWFDLKCGLSYTSLKFHIFKSLVPCTFSLLTYLSKSARIVRLVQFAAWLTENCKLYLFPILVVFQLQRCCLVWETECNCMCIRDLCADSKVRYSSIRSLKFTLFLTCYRTGISFSDKGILGGSINSAILL